MELLKALFTEPIVYCTFGLPVLIVLVYSFDCLFCRSELWGNDLEEIRTRKDNKRHY